MAHALTLLRLILAVPFALAMARPDPAAALWAALLFGVAIATDLLDGIVARRRGTESALGRLFDHAADFLFVMAGLCAAALRGALPWLLPLVVALAFAQYLVDSFLLHRAPRLRMSRLGRANGILYFFPLGGDILARLGLAGLAAPALLVAWALVLTTLASMVDRLLALPRLHRRAPDSPSAGTEDRSPR